MATELEKAVKNLNRALSQASEAERSEFLEQNFQPDQFELPAKEAPASGWKTFFSRLGRILAAAFWIFFRILLWLLKAPFFILSFLKNWFSMGLGLWLLYWFLNLVYQAFVTQWYDTSINETVTWIIVVIAGVLSLIGTTWQYQGKID